MKKHFTVLLFCVGVVLIACNKDKEVEEELPDVTTTTPYNLVIPAGFPAMSIPADNELTVEGVALGRKLFYDPILSGNNIMSCASCHNQQMAFTDNGLQFSLGIDSLPGTRNSMPLFNLGWASDFFWDGGATNLESQVIGPITSEIEMHETLDHALQELNAHPEYPALFNKAFGNSNINTAMLIRAIAQFERTLISGNSRYDKYVRGQETLTAQELNGLNLFTDPNKGDCSHCHVLGSTFTDFEYRNNGLTMDYADEGRARITLNTGDVGKFKTPSLRNIAVTAPYMHDGRFATLAECLDHYNTGFVNHPNLDPVLANQTYGRMNQQEMQDIIAFLNTLTDEEFLSNPAFGKP